MLKVLREIGTVLVLVAVIILLIWGIAALVHFSTRSDEVGRVECRTQEELELKAAELRTLPRGALLMRPSEDGVVQMAVVHTTDAAVTFLVRLSVGLFDQHLVLLSDRHICELHLVALPSDSKYGSLAKLYFSGE